jgi:hypothetical protein
MTSEDRLSDRADAHFQIIDLSDAAIMNIFSENFSTN